MDPPGYQGQTLKLSPINPSHLEKLKSMNLIEMHDDELALTKAGLDAIP